MQSLTILAALAPLLAPALAIPASLLSESDISANETRFRLARRGDFDTSIEVGDKRVAVADESGHPPAAFTVLWDAVENDLCTAQGCDYNRQKCVPSSSVSTVCISARGDFLPDNRNDIISGARGAFDRTVHDGGCGPSFGGDGTTCLEIGTALIDLNAVAGPYSGFGIRVELTVEEEGDVCGDTIKEIAKGGSALPEVGSVFGLVGFFCSINDGSPAATYQATG